ncbi:hypothetical protein ACFIPR_003220 [Enterobacter kobei]
MTNKVDNTAVKQFMENVRKFHDNKEVKEIIQSHKHHGLSKTTKSGLNPLYMFIVLKEADEITNKEVKRIIEQFRIESAFTDLIKRSNIKEEKKYLRSNMKLANGEYNITLLEMFGKPLTVIDERLYRRYGNAIREASRAIQELLEYVPEPVPVVELSRAQKQTIERWITDGMTVEALQEYLQTRKNG